MSGEIPAPAEAVRSPEQQKLEFNREAKERLFAVYKCQSATASPLDRKEADTAKLELKRNEVNDAWHEDAVNLRLFCETYLRADEPGRSEFLKSANFKEPPGTEKNKEAIRHLAPRPKEEQAPKAAPEIVIPPDQPKKEEAPKLATAAEILETLKAKKDPFVEAVREDVKKAKESRRAKNETHPIAQRAFEVATRAVYDLETTAKHYETFFPDTLNEDATPLALLKQATDLRDLTEGLQTIYGKNIPKEIHFEGRKIRIEEELNERIQRSAAKAIVQGWAGETKDAVAIGYPKELTPISHVTSRQREMLTWLGRSDAATTKIHERYQVWTKTIRYDARENETSIVNEKGYLRVEATIRIPSPEDKGYIKEIMERRITTTYGGETVEGNVEREWMRLNAAKAEGMGILLHLRPEFAQKLPEQTDKYLQHLPEGFRASTELKGAQENLKQNPNDEVQKAKYRRELASEWLGLTVTCPEYMAKNFKNEFVICLEILSEPFQRSDVYNNRFIKEANDYGASRYGRGFARFPTVY